MASYFRQHPWQRRGLILLIAFIVLGVAAALAYPIIRDRMLIAQLGSDQPSVRQAAVDKAATQALESPATFKRLVRALDDASDRQFFGIALALRKAKRFEAISQDPQRTDRLRLVEFRSTVSASDPGAADLRYRMVFDAVRAGRDNAYIRQLAQAAAGDVDPAVRSAAALLLAKVGEIDQLRPLLRDKEPQVAASACLAAGAANARQTWDELTARLSDDDAEIASAAGWAMMQLRPKNAAVLILRRINNRNKVLKTRLKHLLSQSDEPWVRDLIGFELDLYLAYPPPAHMIAAAARLRLENAGAKSLLDAAATPSTKVRPARVHAAISVVRAMDIRAVDELNAVCIKLWSRANEPMLAAAARELGRQLAQVDPPLRAKYVRTLELASTYVEPTAATSSEAQMISTPLASAAAACALWQVEPAVEEYDSARLGSRALLEPASAFYVRQVVASAAPLAGDYIAWELPQIDRPKAFELGLAMLPSLDEKADSLPALRSTGAMLLALSASDDAQRQRAVARISQYMGGLGAVQESDYVAHWTYRCALLILGQREHADAVAGLLESSSFPRRRAVTALCLAGDRRGLDWLLLNPSLAASDITTMLTQLRLADVLAEAVPQLPAVHLDVEDDLIIWQCKLLAASYAVKRESIQPGEPR